jgi:uncharacterized membrane protein
MRHTDTLLLVLNGIGFLRVRKEEYMENIRIWGFLGALIAFVLLLALQSYLIKSGRKRAAGTRVVRFWDMIITSEDENYSLSRLQMYLWTVVVVIGFVAVFVSTRDWPTIRQNLYLLMGVNFAASVTSTGVFLAKKNEVEIPPDQPDFVKDIFFERKKVSLDLPRTQMFVWTIVSLCFFAIKLIQSFVVGTPRLPDIPFGLVVLMGVSHGAYIATKATEKEDEKK